MLTSADTVWLKSGNGLRIQLQDAGVQVHTPTAFQPGRFEAATLSKIKREGRRIVVFLASTVDIKAVASRAHNAGMTGGWAWLLVGKGTPTLHMQGWLYVWPLPPPEGMQDFRKQVSEYAKSGFNITISSDSVHLAYSVALHDAGVVSCEYLYLVYSFHQV